MMHQKISFLTNLVNNFLKILLILISYQIHEGSATCYFPIELQGTFLTQTGATQGTPGIGSEVTYSEITIEPDAIPPWGRCHKRRGNNVILKDSTGVEDCMRCIHLSLKTINVIQIHAEGLGKCYTNEEAAKATCPSEGNTREFQEIILYRKHLPDIQLNGIENVFCPIRGRYKITYSADNGKTYCDKSSSELSNCPIGNELQVRFPKCNFPMTEMQFLCLGDWEGQDGHRYLALMDKSADGAKNRPKYRCGIYREEASSGRVYVSLSADSTCKTELIDAETGHESLKLTSAPSRLPGWLIGGSGGTIGGSHLQHYDSIKCRFPEWTQGKWEKARIEGNIFKFQDAKNNFRTLTSKCISRPNASNDRFIIQSSTQCGEQFYSCVWMKPRSTNILEFQFSEKTSPIFSPRLCDEIQFASNAWVTQGKKSVSIETPCPITGDYTGEVPGESGLCAKVASDCNNPDIMFYTVSSCENRSHVFEEREYRCLGNWEEDGTLYTYTQRRDTTGHQCFAGKIMGDGQMAYIREAGDDCIRGEDPMIYGMKITKQAPCPRLSQATSYVPIRPRSDSPKPSTLPAYQNNVQSTAKQFGSGPSIRSSQPSVPSVPSPSRSSPPPSPPLPPPPPPPPPPRIYPIPLPSSTQIQSDRPKPRQNPQHIPKSPISLPYPYLPNRDPNSYQVDVPSPSRIWSSSPKRVFRSGTRSGANLMMIPSLLLILLATLTNHLIT
ncbi:uncharacterized protein LOC141850036 [Brevipalpus obovatus]|uniref:uncharacterized protein LOC141850036 n=1 Tax=Brevipalpus obovatus TaxID=246614 RepID=UPI003D9DC148